MLKFLYSVLLTFFLSTIVIANSGLYDKNIIDYGAVPDGQTINTSAIQNAVNDCFNEGGGRVIVPAGTFLTGSIDLRSNVNLHISDGAILLGSSDIEDYSIRIPELKSYNDIFLEYALIYAEKQHNISITGNGTIDGQGSAFIVTTKVKPDRYKNRPFVIRFVECENVKIKDVTLTNSAMWMQQYLGCKNLFVDGITVINHANKNNDMIDIDGCRNVVMQNCIGDTDDDALTLKSTSIYPTENVTITNCVISSHCNAIKLGTESIGGFRNVTITNIVVKPSRDRDPIYGLPNGISGLTLASVDGGNLEGILISNIRIEGTQVPIYLRLGNRGRTVRANDSSQAPGNYDGVKITDVIATNVTSRIGCSISGIPSYPVKNISLSNISIQFPGGGSREDVNKKIPELEDHYPESTKWGNLPAYGFFVRHAENITFNNVAVSYKEKDIRPALLFDDVKNLKVNGFSGEGNNDSETLIEFNNVRYAHVYNSHPSGMVNSFLKVSGRQSADIFLSGNFLSHIENIIIGKLKDVVQMGYEVFEKE